MHKASIRERVDATFAAIIMLALVPLPFLVELIGAGVLLYACSRLGLSYASRHTLRMLDLTITYTILYFVLYLLQSGLQVVAHDAGMTVPFLSNRLGLFILITLLTTAYLLLMLGFVVYALLGRELRIGLSMGMLEALRGRKTA